MVPINPGSVVKRHDRTDEKARTISKWFLDEKLTIDFGEYVGRPSAMITLQQEYLPRFLENGWTIESVAYTVESGNWSKGSTTNDSGSQYGTVDTTKEIETEYISEIDSTKKSTSSEKTQRDQSSETKSNKNYTSSNASTSSGSTTSNGSNSSSQGESSSSSSTSSNGTNSSTTINDERQQTNESTNEESVDKYTSEVESTEESTTDEKHTTTEDHDEHQVSGSSSDSIQTIAQTGEAYWATVQRVNLVRRRMQPELVLQDMITSYVNERNEGVRNEDARYNELVTLYGIVLNRNETEGNNIINNALDVTGLFNTLRTSIDLNWTAANNYAMQMGRESVEGDTVEIKLKYEALLSQKRSQMIDQGTYNGTVWPTVEAGILRQMEAAMAEAKRGAYKATVDAQVSVLNAKGDVMAQLVSAKNAIAAAIDQRRITVTELRNTVVNAMLNFMGSREDVYPQIQEISNLASQIGFSVGAAGNVL